MRDFDLKNERKNNVIGQVVKKSMAGTNHRNPIIRIKKACEKAKELSERLTSDRLQDDLRQGQVIWDIRPGEFGWPGEETVRMSRIPGDNPERFLYRERFLSDELKIPINAVRSKLCELREEPGLGNIDAYYWVETYRNPSGSGSDYRLVLKVSW